ncbi:MAG TPA: cation diffusion facilitator family transporter [Methanoregula sp.]|nr:cation diffusion facilitator family transporter [Methanoregula sp.]
MTAQKTADTRNLVRVAFYSLLVNAGLVFIKLTLSFSTGSLSLAADAVHSFIDIIGSGALILGIIISQRKSSSFPYGMYKVENFVAVIIALLLFGTAYEIVYQALFSASEIQKFSPWVLVLVAALILVPFLFGRYEIRMGTQFNSPGLIADGKNFTADVLSSTVVFLGLLGQYMQFPVDRIAAIIVAIFIVRAGWGILVNGMRVLLDASIDIQTLDTIRSTILADPAVVEIKVIMGRNSGRYVFVEADIVIRSSGFNRAHQISERIEREIKRAVPNVDHTVLHYEPPHTTKVRYLVALADQEGSISEHFGEAPFFGVVDLNTGSNAVERTEVISNPHQQVVKGKGIMVANFLATLKPDIIVTREDLAGKGPGYVFADAGIETVQTDADTMGSFIQQSVKKADPQQE